MAFYLASVLTFYSGILPGALSDILFWHSLWHSIWNPTLAFCLALYLKSDCGILSSTLRSGALGWSAATEISGACSWMSGSAHWDLELAVEVPQCRWDLELAVEIRKGPLRSAWSSQSRPGSAHWDRWGPAAPTEIWSSQLRPGSDRWDLALAVEVRQCPLKSLACPAVPPIWSSRLKLKSGSAHWDLELAVEVRWCRWDLELTVELRQCPLRFCARSPGPAVPTEIVEGRQRALRSGARSWGSGRWGLALAVEVRQGP